MSAADLLEDGFPHSTPEGYRRGCRGSACPGVLEHGWSCSRAQERFNGDFWYRKQVEAGRSPAEIKAAQLERDVVPAKKAAKQVAEPVQKPAPAADEFPHGTPNGYWRGCRTGCPGGPDGRSCREALAEYAREKRAAARKPAAPAPKPAPPKTFSVEPTASVDVAAEWERVARERQARIDELAREADGAKQRLADQTVQLSKMAGDLKTAREELTAARAHVARLEQGAVAGEDTRTFHVPGVTVMITVGGAS